MANFNFNKVILGGRLATDPELKQTQTGVPVCTVSVAVNRRMAKEGDPKADFLNVTFWRKNAETLCQYFRKGSSVAVVGSLQTRQWEKDGQKHYATEIVADELYFVESKGEAQVKSAAAQETPASYAPASQDAQPAQMTYIPESYRISGTPPFLAGSDDEELPF